MNQTKTICQTVSTNELKRAERYGVTEPFWLTRDVKEGSLR